MNRFDYTSDDPMMATALRYRLLARCAACLVVMACIVAITVHTAWSDARNGFIDAGSNNSAVAKSSTDEGLDAQLRLDPSELMFYSSNVHG